MFLHSVPYPHGDASPAVLIGYMVAGAGVGLAIAFWREVRDFGRRVLNRDAAR